MRKIVIVLAILFVIGIVPLISLSYSEYVSPKKQIESGVLPEDVMCRDNKVLVLRSSGNIACVFEKTANKLNWEIIQTVFEIKDNKVNSLNIDLSEITLKSNVLEGDYTTGLFTESQKGLMRGPAPLPFATSINVVVNQDGSVNFSHLPEIQADTMAIALADNSQHAIKKPDEYLKYFPQYVPDGQELKFFTFEGHVLGARLHLVYAPIVISVDPLMLTQEKLADVGGIEIVIRENPNIAKHKDGFVTTAKELQYVIDTESYPPYTLIHTWINDDISGGLLMWDNDSSVSFQFDSSSYSVTELLKMAETALNQN